VSYAAEPYVQFVDDLLTSLTGGIARERFVFTPDNGAYQITPPGPMVKSSLRLFGLADGSFMRFRSDRDFTLQPDNSIDWKKRADGTPAAGAVWPDPGTPFFANYDYTGPAAAPLLTDRNTGSVTRLLAESFGREYSVLSRQLEAVYLAPYLDTASGRDLDQVVALVGLQRRDRTYAVGTVVFARATPAAADVFIAAGTRISTVDAPIATFETSEDCTLTRGSLSVEAPIRAVVSGAPGVVPPQTIIAINRPILGIDSVTNGDATQLIGNDETDDALRVRARRALEGAGKATRDAIIAALTTLPAIRPQDILVSEDPLLRPGMIRLGIAAQLTADDVPRAIDLVEQSRPAGIRIQYAFDSSIPLGTIDVGANPDDDSATSDDALAVSTQSFLPVAIYAVLVPISGSLTGQERESLKSKAEDALTAVVDNAGVGATLVYNQLVAVLMGLNGVQDVTLDLCRAGSNPPSHRNLVLAPQEQNLRPTVDPTRGGSLDVEIAGQLIALDLVLKLTLKGAGALGDIPTDLEDARVQAAAQLRTAVRSMSSLSAANLKAAVTSLTFTVDSVGFTIEFVQSGVRINKTFDETAPAISISPLQKLWVRTVKLDPASA
jgi:phage-related baseplate assembly protein